MKLTDEMLCEYAQRAEELWLSVLPANAEIPEHKFSKKFEKRMKKLIRNQRRAPWVNKCISISKRAAVVAFAILTVSFSCLMCVEAYRAKFIEVITEIFEDLTQFSFSSSFAAPTELGELTFDYLPDGISEVYRESGPQNRSLSIYFEDVNGQRIRIEQEIVASGKQTTMILDTENAEVSTINFNGYEATLIVKGEHTTLMWEDDISVMLVSGDFPPSEITKIASGIHTSKK